MERYSVRTPDQTEDRIIHAAVTDSGVALDYDTSHRLLTLPATSSGEILSIGPQAVADLVAKEQLRIGREISERNASFFEAEAAKLDRWADDLKLGLEREIKDFDRQIKEARRAASAALTLEEKLSGQKRIKVLENHRKERRRSLFDAQDEIDAKRESLIEGIQTRLKSNSESETLFTIRWNLT